MILEVRNESGIKRNVAVMEMLRPEAGMEVIVRSFGSWRFGRIVETKRSRVLVKVPRDSQGNMVERMHAIDQCYVRDTDA